MERDAQELADSLGVKIFQADIIYHLFDKFMAYREELKQKKREEFRSIAVFPCKLKVGTTIYIYIIVHKYIHNFNMNLNLNFIHKCAPRALLFEWNFMKEQNKITSK